MPENDEAALVYAVSRQPVSVGIEASGLDFQLYAGVRIASLCSKNSYCIHVHIYTYACIRILYRSIIMIYIHIHIHICIELLNTVHSRQTFTQTVTFIDKHFHR